MRSFPLRSDKVSLAVTETGGQLSDIRFRLDDDREVAPMHTAPWAEEPLGADLPPMLRLLRGDFFCAPFGDNDVISEDGPAHGASANGIWRLERSDGSSLDAVLADDIMGARVSKHVALRAGQAVVYEHHRLSGGVGRLPVGHHAMVRAETPLRLGFGPFTWAGTPPEPVETPPTGRSILAYPQEIADLGAVRRADGEMIDLTAYPAAEGHEDLWMLVADRDKAFAWTTASAPEAGWLWFAIKDPRVLPETVVWLSNGGRDYPPFSGRHRRVIGLEETCSYFHLGHRASIADNPLARRGIPTAIELRPEGEIAISYLFGVVAVGHDFGPVADVRRAVDGIVLADADGREAFAACDLDFVTNAETDIPTGGQS